MEADATSRAHGPACQAGSTVAVFGPAAHAFSSRTKAAATSRTVSATRRVVPIEAGTSSGSRDPSSRPANLMPAKGVSNAVGPASVPARAAARVTGRIATVSRFATRLGLTPRGAVGRRPIADATVVVPEGTSPCIGGRVASASCPGTRTTSSTRVFAEGSVATTTT